MTPRSFVLGLVLASVLGAFTFQWSGHVARTRENRLEHLQRLADRVCWVRTQGGVTLPIESLASFDESVKACKELRAEGSR